MGATKRKQQAKHSANNIKTATIPEKHSNAFMVKNTKERISK